MVELLLRKLPFSTFVGCLAPTALPALAQVWGELRTRRGATDLLLLG